MYKNLVMLLLACTACAGAVHRDSPNEASASAAVPEAPRPVVTGAVGSGMRVYLDPQTGLPTTPPPGVPLAEGPNTSRPDAGLREEEVPGGGFKVELGGRLQNDTRPPKVDSEDH